MTAVWERGDFGHPHKSVLCLRQIIFYGAFLYATLYGKTDQTDFGEIVIQERFYL